MSSKWLTGLNAVAMPSSLAALTVQGLLWMRAPTWAIALPTVLSALLWLWVFRTVKKIQRAVILAIPIAMLNASLAAALAFSSIATGADRVASTFVMGLVLGPLAGVVIWLPALVFVLVLYGVPLMKARRLAERGLAGAERGERIVAVVSAGLPLLMMLVMDRMDPLARGLALVAMLSGALAAALATLRARARSGFVRSVTAGEVEGFRVEQTEHGAALTRVTSYGEGYRVVDFHEELCLLDEQGEVAELRAKL